MVARNPRYYQRAGVSIMRNSDIVGILVEGRPVARPAQRQRRVARLDGALYLGANALDELAEREGPDAGRH